MADHAHTQIRNSLKNALSGLATTASRVYANRLHPLDAGSVPGLRISLDDERVEALTIHGPALYARTLTAVVECCAQANAALDDTADQMQKEVEIALADGLDVGGKRLVCLLQSSNFDDAAGAANVAVKRLEYELSFQTLADAPDTLI